LPQKFICKELQYRYHLTLQEKIETLIPVSRIILLFFRYQSIKLWRSLKYCHFLDEIPIILRGMLGIFWGTGKIVIYSMNSVVNTKWCYQNLFTLICWKFTPYYQYY